MRLASKTVCPLAVADLLLLRTQSTFSRLLASHQRACSERCDRLRPLAPKVWCWLTAPRCRAHSQPSASVPGGDGPPHVTMTLHHPKIIGSAPASPYTNPATTARVLRTCHSTHQRRRSHLELPQDCQHEYSHIMLALRAAQCAMQAWCDIIVDLLPYLHSPAFGTRSRAPTPGSRANK